METNAAWWSLEALNAEVPDHHHDSTVENLDGTPMTLRGSPRLRISAVRSGLGFGCRRSSLCMYQVGRDSSSSVTLDMRAPTTYSKVATATTPLTGSGRRRSLRGSLTSAAAADPALTSWQWNLAGRRGAIWAALQEAARAARSSPTRDAGPCGFRVGERRGFAREGRRAPGRSLPLRQRARGTAHLRAAWAGVQPAGDDESGITAADEVFHLVAPTIVLSILAHPSTDVLVARALDDAGETPGWHGVLRRIRRARRATVSSARRAGPVPGKDRTTSAGGDGAVPDSDLTDAPTSGSAARRPPRGPEGEEPVQNGG